MIFGVIMIFSGISIMVIYCTTLFFTSHKSIIKRILSILIALIIIGTMIFVIKWYFTNTASGQRAVLDHKSNINNGLERTVTVYTADGKIIAEYTGLIDIETNDGGYVKFDFEGKRYIYYNCFIESIADIE